MGQVSPGLPQAVVTSFFVAQNVLSQITRSAQSYFVSQLSDAQRQSIVGMINLDMVGVGDSSRVGGSDSMVRLARAAGSRMGLTLGDLPENGGSDHAPFIRAGIPALFIYRSNDPNYHSPNDKAMYVDPANLQIAGDLALDVIAGLERGG